MPGRPLTRERKRIEAERVEQLKTSGIEPEALPTERRREPAAFQDALLTEVIQLGERGLSEAEMASHLAVSLATFNGWREDHPAFSDAMDRALTASQGWWETQVRRAIMDGDTRFAVGAWQACVKARFPGYNDRVEVAHTFDVTSRLVELDLRTPELARSVLIEGAAEARSPIASGLEP